MIFRTFSLLRFILCSIIFVLAMFIGVLQTDALAQEYKTHRFLLRKLISICRCIGCREDGGKIFGIRQAVKNILGQQELMYLNRHRGSRDLCFIKCNTCSNKPLLVDAE